MAIYIIMFLFVFFFLNIQLKYMQVLIQSELLMLYSVFFFSFVHQVYEWHIPDTNRKYETMGNVKIAWGQKQFGFHGGRKWISSKRKTFALSHGDYS